MKAKLLAILKSLLIVLFLSYYLGGTAFTHTHHFLTYSITHSHPYLPGSDGQPHHTHDSVAFNTIELLDSIVADVVVFTVLGVLWVLLTTYIQEQKEKAGIFFTRSQNLRAPPVLV